MNLTRTSWAGWSPSSDKLGGDPSLLLRMDNLQLDEQGAIGLARGLQHKADFNDFVESIYSKTIDGVDTIYVCTDSGRSVQKSTNLTAFTEIVAGDDHAAIGDAFGQVLICAGTQKKKEQNGTVKNLGLAPINNAPIVASISQDHIDLPAGFSVVDGTVGGLGFFVDSTSLTGVVRASGSETNTVELGGNTEGYDLNQDTVSCVVQFTTQNFKRVRMEIVLNASNFYWYEWLLENSTDFTRGRNAQSILRVKRGDFTRVGDDSTLDWKKVTGVTFIVEAITEDDYLVSEPRITGGPRGGLQGFYEWAVQPIGNDGRYLAKAPISPISKSAYVEQGRASISFDSSADATEYWIYRRSVIEQVETDLIQSSLDKFYRVGTSVGNTFEDTTSDIDAIRLNITVSETLQSVQDIGPSILGILGPYKERILYMTFQEILLSDRLNPDAIDLEFSIRVSGDITEKNLWFTELSSDTILLATTKDFYELSGTFLDQPDGSIDVFIRKLGDAFPALSTNFAKVEGIVYYVAKDGVRATNGGTSTLISPELNELFSNKVCHDIPPIGIFPGSIGNYAIAIGRGKLYTSLPLTDGSRRLFVYSFTNKRWNLRITDPVSLCATVSGKILAGYGNPNSLYQIEEGVGLNDTTGIAFELRTVFDDNQQPRNRKDTFTLKLIGDTGGVDVTVLLAKDGETYTNIGMFNSNGLSTKYFTIDEVTLGFRYSLKLTGTAMLVFKLNEYTIEYDARPEQLTMLRIPSNNLGTLARKRMISYAFVIDTLGNDVTFTPYADGSTKPTSTVNKASKLTHRHFFTSNTECVDIGGLLQTNDDTKYFEYYGPNLEETISEKLPAPAKYLIIPANDYGNPNRKRHTSYKFQINTRGFNVRFTPKLDGTEYTASIVNTTEKRTHEHYFPLGDGDVIGIDIGGTLETLANQEFEFYGTIVPQKIEFLPDKLKSLYLPETNLGVASWKRVRTLPIVINTFGKNVSFTPVVDGSSGTAQTLNTPRRQTVHYYFTSDSFGLDYTGFLQSDEDTPFEFYGFGEFEQVEVLPVPKKLDQLQPIRWDKIGKLFTFRTRLIMRGLTSTMPYAIYSEVDSTVPFNNGTPLHSGTFAVDPFRDNVYEVDMPHNINGTMIRIVLGPTNDPFHRYDLQAKVSTSGMESDSKWIQVR